MKKLHRSNPVNILWLKIHRTVVPALLRFGQPLVIARRWLRPQKIPLCRVEPTAKDDQPPLAILCSGASEHKNFFLNRAFAGSRRELNLGKAKLRDIFRSGFAGNKNCSLVAIETNQTHFLWLQQEGWFFMPVWVQGGVHLPLAEVITKNESVKSDQRKIKRNGLEYLITHDKAHFHDFYHEMHIPFIQKTHGDEAMFDSYAEKRAQCENYDLLLVHKKDRPDYTIAGMLIVYEPAGPRLWSLGVRQDGEDYVRQGILPALYSFSFAHLSQRHSWVSLGSSRAFLHDGVLNFKRKFLLAITAGSWNGFALKITALTPATKSFLLKNPFIFQTENALHAAVFTEEKISAETIQRWHKEYFYSGLKHLVIHSFRDDETFSPVALPPALAGCVTIRRLGEWFKEPRHLP